MTALRMTLPTQLVLRQLLEDPDREMYGLEICMAAGLPSGTIHPILARLERVGWIRSRWEEVEPSSQGRPRRKYFQLDPNAISQIQASLRRTEKSTSAIMHLRPGLAGDIK